MNFKQIANCLLRYTGVFTKPQRSSSQYKKHTFLRKSTRNSHQSTFLQYPYNSKRYYTNSATNLPVLNALIESATSTAEFSLKDTAIVCVQHSLKTSVDLLKSLNLLGGNFSNMFVTGKFYSESPEVVHEIKKLGIWYQESSPPIQLGGFEYATLRDINLLWAKCSEEISKKEVKHLIVLDHGGRCLSSIPPKMFEKYSIVGLEKTNAGIISFANYDLPFPIIEVASSAAKNFLESPLIAQATVSKLLPILPLQTNLHCGVIGYGSIGKALTHKLTEMGYKVIVYDRDFSKINNLNGAIRMSSLPQLVDNSDYIFGCTGQDIGSVDILKETVRDKVLISCSSEDKEFLSFLLFLRKELNGKAPRDRLSTIKYVNQHGANIKILKGGFPVNFDHSGESVPANDVQLTRALVLSGVLQANMFLKKKNFVGIANSYMLDPQLQQFVVKEWLKYQPQARISEDLIKKFDDLQWIINNSGGIYVPFKNTLENKLNPLSNTVQKNIRVENILNNDQFNALTDTTRFFKLSAK